MLKRFDIRINHDMGECLYTVEAKSSKSAIETVEKEWHKDHKGYTGTPPKFTVQKTYTHAEKKSLGGLLLAFIGGVYLYKVYTNKKTTAKGKASLENYRSESGKYKNPSSRRKAQDPDDVFQAEKARMSNRKKAKDVKDIFAKGGNVRIIEDREERLGRPESTMESDILSRVHYDKNLFVGNFGWRTPSGKLADGYFYALDDFDKNLVKSLRLKDGEKIYRYFNRTTAIGGMSPLIKINVDKGLLYFAQELENPDYDAIKFETRGTKAEWISLIKEKYAKGGGVGMTKSIGLLYNKTRRASKDSGDVVYLNSENINLDGYTNLKPYSVKASDEEIKIGFSVPNQQTMVYFSNETTKKNIDRTSFEKYNGSIYIAEPLTEKVATDILKKMEFFERYANGGNVNEGIPQPIIDMFDESYVFLKAKYPQYENLPLIEDTEEFWDMVEDVRENFDTDTPTNYGEIGEELVRNYLYGYEKRFEETKYAKGGTLQENLTKELHKLQRDLNSSRLSTYFEGDTSENEMARQRERDSKIKRFNEVLETLNELDTKYADGGDVKSIRGLKKLNAKRFHQGTDYIYHDEKTDKYYFIDNENDLMEIKNIHFLSDIKQAYISEPKYAEGGRTPRAWGYPPKMTNKEIVDYLKDYNYAVVEPLDYLAGFMDKVFFISYGRKMGYLTDWQKTKEECMYHFENLQMGASEGGFKLQAKIIKLTPEAINDILLQTNYMYTTYKNGGSIDTIEFATGGEIKSADSQKIVTILKKLRNAKANYLQAIKDSVRSISPIFHQYPNGSVAQQKISDLIRNLNDNLDYTVDKNWRLFENQIQNSIEKFSQGGTIDLFEDYENIPTALQEVLDEYNEAFEDGDYSGLKDALTAVESMGYTFEYGLDGEAYGLRPKSTPLSQLQGYEDSEEFATGGGVSSGIKVGDWVTLKSDGKRYKVKRVLSNNMIEITAGAKTLTVNISDVETNVKFFRSKFVPVPTNIEVKFKIGDRLKFNTKKGITEVGKVLLYKYVPTQNTIIYTIATDSGWKASVLQENLSKEYTSFTIPSDNTPSPAPKQPTQKAVVKNTPPLTTFSIPSIEVGDKIEIIGSPNLTGTVTKVLSSTNEAEVLLSDSTGMTIKKGKSVPFTFSTSKIKKV